MVISHQLNIVSITKTTFNCSSYLIISAKNVSIINEQLLGISEKCQIAFPYLFIRMYQIFLEIDAFHDMVQIAIPHHL